eukprot:CAMPEP_0197854980 /NCGR_PEP_ID=MMETSP1438-20131217/25720_1 /TAXON_ID=1461541 /ORGANISM="Pterosperma sp., Strain CCMP1384" /LENGTH=39 /DNA_ID= /DNA_START= /DNA_END= /DNA_ORIENTATION=
MREGVRSEGAEELEFPLAVTSASSPFSSTSFSSIRVGAG